MRTIINKSFIKVALFVLIMVVGVLFSPVDSRAENVTPPKEVKEAAEMVGEIYDISPEFIEAIAYYESHYDADAANKWCTGLMQVSQKWHQDRMKKLGVTDLTDPYQNILVATDYLAELMEKYHDVGMVLMVYNGDKDAKAYYRGDAPVSEYADKIIDLASELEVEHGKE